MHRVLVTCKQMQDFLAKRQFENFEFVCPTLTGQSFSSIEMQKLSQGFELVVAGDDELDRSFFEAAHTLRLLIRWGVGTDSVDFGAASEVGIRVVNTPGVFNTDVAELALCYLFMLARRVVEIHVSVSQGSWPKYQGETLEGKRIGILGFGGIGQKLAQLAASTGMAVQACDPFADTASFESINFHDSLEALADNSDYLVLTAPLTPMTFHTINEGFFARLEHPVRLVNVARGALVDEKCIPDAFKSGKLIGFASDVFEAEPLPDYSPLRGVAGTVFGSHNASNTLEGVARASEACLALLEDFTTQPQEGKENSNTAPN